MTDQSVKWNARKLKLQYTDSMWHFYGHLTTCYGQQQRLYCSNKSARHAIFAVNIAGRVEKLLLEFVVCHDDMTWLMAQKRSKSSVAFDAIWWQLMRAKQICKALKLIIIVSLYWEVNGKMEWESLSGFRIQGYRVSSYLKTSTLINASRTSRTSIVYKNMFGTQSDYRLRIISIKRET